MHHVGHHKVQFPLRDLRARSYGRSKEAGGTKHAKPSDGWFETGGELVFGIPAVTLCVMAMWYLPLSTAIIIILVVAYVILSGDILHSSFHLYDDALSHPESLSVHRWLVSRKWFREYQHLHDIHHAHTNSNFGFGDFTMDYLFGTFSSESPSFLKHPPPLSTQLPVQ
jgi:hypothetical protein